MGSAAILRISSHVAKREESDIPEIISIEIDDVASETLKQN